MTTYKTYKTYKTYNWNGFVDQMERLRLPANQLLILQGGKIAAQYRREPYSEDVPQLLFSLSKSFTSIAVGIARDLGYVRLEDKVISYFPDKLPEHVSPNLGKMTLHHLLSMNAGHHDNIYEAVAGERDWVKAFLEQEVQHEPGSCYRYSTHATYMLSAIVERATGKSLVDFLMPTLFEPLGIPRPDWEKCPLGITAGGMGLSLTIDSVAKVGQMLLDKGVYNGKRIVSEDYIERAVAEQSDNRTGRTDRPDWEQGYGYQFHRCRRGCYRGDGSFGQLLFVAPSHNIVIAATASFPNMGYLQTLLQLVYDHALECSDTGGLGKGDPSRVPDSAFVPFASPVLSASDFSAAGSEVRPKELRLQHNPSGRAELSKESYCLEDNPQDLRMITFQWHNDKFDVQFEYEDGRDGIIPFDLTKSCRTKDVFHKDLSVCLQETVAYAAWEDESRLRLDLHYIETPYAVAYTLDFHDNGMLTVRFAINVSLHLKDYCVSGRRLPKLEGRHTGGADESRRI